MLQRSKKRKATVMNSRKLVLNGKKRELCPKRDLEKYFEATPLLAYIECH